MADDSVLLARIEADEALFRSLEWHCDFAVSHRVPVDELLLSSGDPLVPVAQCGAGGTYFLCGSSDAAERPVLYVTSEGVGCLIADSLHEALELLTGVPYWRDCLRRIGDAPLPPAQLDALETDYRDAVPDSDPVHREATAHALGISTPARTTLLSRLRDAIRRTRPHYVVHTAFGWPYDTL
ncbi:hypothetical protein [Streptomyces sp. RFCAC02]|uniref:hypothetical protein n=1 Tax=Streptomyces sp. RFCAC02 TaxID=2499143 RepID=UPI0010218694|nr:hypothetical protein [Streptomyces sp. RFCAC02]